MKIQLIDSRTGVAKAIILKEWMRIGLSICLLGLPVILGYLSIQMADARNAEFAKDAPTPALGDEYNFSGQVPRVQDNALDRRVVSARQYTQQPGSTGGLIQNFQQPLRMAFTPQSPSHRYSQQDQQDTYYAGPAIVKHLALTLFAKYGDVLKKGQIVVLAGVSGYLSPPFPRVAIHKNGRIIDPASYIHSTIR